MNADYAKYGEYSTTTTLGGNKEVIVEIKKEGVVTYVDFSTYINGVFVSNTTTGNNFTYGEVATIFGLVKAELDAISGGKPVVFAFEATCAKRDAVYKRLVKKLGARTMPSSDAVVKFIYCSK